jgi:carboxymethylenebutenolidase
MQDPVHSSWLPLGHEGFEGYLALPPAGAGPGLLLWQEIFGVNAHIQTVARQYALAGFVVLAPDVFWRQQRRVALGYAGDAFARGRALAGTLQAETLRDDVLTALGALRALPATAGCRTGSIGYCLGGRLAYLTAVWDDVDAAVAYYGGGIQDQLQRLADVRCALQFHYAGHDEHIPPAAVERVREAIADRVASGQAELHVYADAHHGFNCWERGSYHAPSAALALGRSLRFLAERLF